jgi:hypothetical protein
VSDTPWAEIQRRGQDAWAEKQQRRDAARATGETCGECGKEFSDEQREKRYRVSEYNSPFVVMCADCAPEWLVTGRGKPVRIMPAIEVHTWECAGCGSEVVFGMSEFQHRKRVYCSDACRKRYARERYNTEQKQRTATREHERACEVCGRTFRSKRSDAKTCSDACRQRAYRLRTSASTHSGE